LHEIPVTTTAVLLAFIIIILVILLHCFYHACGITVEFSHFGVIATVIMVLLNFPLLCHTLTRLLEQFLHVNSDLYV